MSTSLYTVQFAVYGALNNGNQDWTQAVDVSQTLASLLNTSGSNGIVALNNTTMGGDPSPGNAKHFAAVVTYNNVPGWYACWENQSIDFKSAIPQNPEPVTLPTPPSPPSPITAGSGVFQVNYAIYGALNNNAEDQAQAFSLSSQLAAAITAYQGIVPINNTTFGGDPCFGYTKNFGACLSNGANNYYFACQEGQTIDFFHWVSAATLQQG
jgi:hypothetical protein